MKPARTVRTIVASTFAISTLLTPAAWAEDDHKSADHLMVTPTDLKWADVPSLPPGAKVTLIEGKLDEPVPFTLRLQFPADYQVPAHWHPAIEHVTVLSGTINMGMGDKLDTSKTVALPTGSMAIMQPNTHHFLFTEEGAITQVHGVGPWAINYVNPTDVPRKK